MLARIDQNASLSKKGRDFNMAWNVVPIGFSVSVM
jgi:hypothetical protein